MQSDNIVFLDRETAHIERQENITLILSPTFYWFKKEQLKISLFEAKKLAPSLFEGITPPGNYRYVVQKIDSEYWFFAFEEEIIIKKLEELGINLSQIKKIYFAQSLLKSISEPVITGDKVLINQKGYVVALPKNIAQAKKNLQDISIAPTTKAIQLKRSSHFFIPDRMLYLLSGVIFGLTLLYLIQLFIYQKEIEDLESKRAQIIQKHHLPPTSFQLDAILHSLEQIDHQQRSLRETLAFLLSAPLTKSESFQNIDIDKDKVSFSISDTTPQRVKVLKQYFSKKITLNKDEFKNNRYVAEGRYE